MVTCSVFWVGETYSRKVSNRMAFSRAGRILDVAFKQDTSGRCDAVRAGARITNSPRKVHWKSAAGIFAFTGILFWNT